MNAKEKAVQLAENIKNADLPASEKFGIAVVLAAAGLGTAKGLLLSGSISPMQGLSLLDDLRLLVKELEDAIIKH